VEFRGNRFISSPKRALRCEIIYSDGKTQMFCSEDDILVSQEGMNKSFEAGETIPHGSDKAAR
jgi:hypothetical protein